MKGVPPIGMLLTPRGSAWTLLILVLAIGAGGLAPPIAPSSTPGAAGFSADRAIHHIATISREPHPIGSSASHEVRQHIVDQLESLDLEPRFQEFDAPDYYGVSDGAVTGVNVMARLSGVESTGALVLMAHYDSVPTTPGANDDASGVAVVLETARALRQGSRLRNDVILLFTDGEEPAPRYGASAFIDRHPWVDDIKLVVNLEAVGGSGPSLLIETSGPEGWLVSKFAAAAQGPRVYSFLTEFADLVGRRLEDSYYGTGHSRSDRKLHVLRCRALGLGDACHPCLAAYREPAQRSGSCRRGRFGVVAYRSPANTTSLPQQAGNCFANSSFLNRCCQRKV